jgi:uncharacterized protein with HEPN domain
MPATDDRVYVREMLDAIDRVGRFVAGMDLDGFLADEKTQSAVIRQFEVIGGAARHVGAAFREAHPEVPWRKAALLRTLLTHEHSGVGAETVWRTIGEDLPALRALLAGLVRG